MIPTEQVNGWLKVMGAVTSNTYLGTIILEKVLLMTFQIYKIISPIYTVWWDDIQSIFSIFLKNCPFIEFVTITAFYRINKKEFGSLFCSLYNKNVNHIDKHGHYIVLTVLTT